MSKISNEMGITNPSKEEIEEVIQELDVDKNGVLSLEEFAVNCVYIQDYFRFWSNKLLN